MLVFHRSKPIVDGPKMAFVIVVHFEPSAGCPHSARKKRLRSEYSSIRFCVLFQIIKQSKLKVSFLIFRMVESFPNLLAFSDRKTLSNI